MLVCLLQLIATALTGCLFAVVGWGCFQTACVDQSVKDLNDPLYIWKSLFGPVNSCQT